MNHDDGNTGREWNLKNDISKRALKRQRQHLNKTTNLKHNRFISVNVYVMLKAYINISLKSPQMFTHTSVK